MTEATFTYNRDELTVVIERVFAAPRDVVWQTITTPDLIPRWWGPEKYPTRVETMDVRVGGTWRFLSDGGQGNEMAFSGEYKVIEPPLRLTQTFNFEPAGLGHESTETTVLEALADGRTRMTVTVVYGSQEDYDGTIEAGMESGARETWERLAGLVVAEKLSLTITRVFDAPRERVWQAWTDPQQIEQWWGPEGFSTRVERQELRAGGRSRYVMVGPDGTEYPVEGAFIEITPQEKIVTTDEFAEDYQPPTETDLPTGMITTFLFEDMGEKTKVTIIITHPTVEQKAQHEAMGVVAGWDSSLDCLAGYLQAQ